MMKLPITHRPGHRRASQRDANLTVPSELTDLIIEEIRSLSGREPAVTYLQSEFLTKFVSEETDPPEVRRQRAIAKWLSVERDNAATNDRLLTYTEDYQILPRVSWSKFCSVVQSIIVSVIGDSPPESALIGEFSGGASTSRKRTESHPASKYLGRADITSAAKPWFELALESMPGWELYSEGLVYNEVSGNVLFTVPKTTTIDRCAAKEPDLNMFLQKGVGNYIRSSLKKFGIDLNDQTRNQRLAERGSLNGDLATVDLSSASDSISSGLVELMMPPCWFVLLDDIRSPTTLVGDEEHVNEMFSSMGNGFTFELESLLFYSMARAVAYLTNARGVISVYGDDIICPAVMFTDLCWVFQCVGFAVNSSKSFADGPFRESCGGHYHNGSDVTPFYIRKPIRRMTDLIHMCNSLRRWSERRAISGILPRDVEDLWLFLKSFIPECFWGGSDLTSITQLCSPDNPAKRLMALSVEKKENECKKYLYWLNLSCKGYVSSITGRWDTDYQNFPRSIPGPLAQLYRGVDVRLDTHIPVLAFLENARQVSSFEWRRLETSTIKESVQKYRIRNSNCERFHSSVFLTEV